MSKKDIQEQLTQHYQTLLKCKACPLMVGPVVSGKPILSKVLLVGQAPGPKEGSFGKPFAWTAGKTMFKWFSQIGVEEEDFRNHAYMAAVCRCFPGKNPKGGDRVPNDEEIKNCSKWMEREFKLVQPELVIPIGKLAIKQFLEVEKLDQIIGNKFTLNIHDITCDVIPLPHPSGASTWHRKEPGITLLKKALKKIQTHPAWQSIL